VRGRSIDASFLERDRELINRTVAAYFVGWWLGVLNYFRSFSLNSSFGSDVQTRQVAASALLTRRLPQRWTTSTSAALCKLLHPFAAATAAACCLQLARRGVTGNIIYSNYYSISANAVRKKRRISRRVDGPLHCLHTGALCKHVR
jgi:hypothetical protein